MRAGKRLDSRAWLFWALAAAFLVMLGRNPLYLVILLLVSRVVAAARGIPGQGVELPLARIGLVILAFSIILNTLFIHVGQTVLVRLPLTLPLVGGPITLEAAVYGAANGLMLLTLLSIFLTFNQVVTVGELVRLAPRAFYDLGVVLLVAMTYVPETSRHLGQIREAQAIRGHRLRGIGDWRPLIIPLLVGGLERAMNLAEAMVARGYGAAAGRNASTRLRVAMLVSLIAGLAGWALAIWLGWPGWLLFAGGLGVLLFLIWSAGRGIQYTRYRAANWKRIDTIVVAAALAPILAIVLPLPFVSSAVLDYSPYPILKLPRFDPLLGLLFVLLVIPVFSHD